MSKRGWHVALLAALVLAGARPAYAAPAPYPAMARMAAYLSANRADEIALARSAAPPSISDAAEIYVFGAKGYDVAVQGTNGFACIVERSWANDFDNAEFWNPKIRTPQCFNAPASRSVLPEYLKRTQWVLSGASPSQMADRAKAAVAAKEITAPEPGSVCYMMSKLGYINDDAAGPWHPHVMVFTPPTPPAEWGANMPGSPVFSAPAGIEPIATFMVPVSKWSDGTKDAK